MAVQRFDIYFIDPWQAPALFWAKIDGYAAYIEMVNLDSFLPATGLALRLFRPATRVTWGRARQMCPRYRAARTQYEKIYGKIKAHPEPEFT